MFADKIGNKKHKDDSLDVPTQITLYWIPEHFNTDEEAGRFWDTHSAADYWDEMGETEMEFDIKQRSFLVPINDRLYQLAKVQAEARHCKVAQIINTLLDRQLVGTK